MKHKLLIAGSRTFNDYNLLEKTLKANNIECIISGCATGADTLGIIYAKAHKIPTQLYPAEWNKYGKSAGYIRNKQMVNQATACICFWDGKSRGTKHTIDLAKQKNIPLKVVLVQ